MSLRAYADRLVLVAEAQVVAEHERVFSRDLSEEPVANTERYDALRGARHAG